MLWEGAPVGRWVVGTTLSEGLDWCVYRAVSDHPDEAVALKMPVRVTSEMLVRAQAQATLLSTVVHPNVVRGRGHLSVGAARVIVMDLVDGVPCATLRFGPARALVVVEGLLDGLEALHGAGLVHRGLCPENVLIAAEGTRPRPVLVGFGRSVAVGERGLPVAVASPFVAPELQREPTLAATSADVFAVGALAYTLVCGHAPFEGDPAGVLAAMAARRFARPRRIVDLSPEQEDAIVGALHPDPGQRIPDCATFREVWEHTRVTHRWALPPLLPTAEEPIVHFAPAADPPPMPASRPRPREFDLPATIPDDSGPPRPGGRGWAYLLAAVATAVLAWLLRLRS